MRVIINPHQFSGVIRIPPSKSHTIRQLFIASLADGVSEIKTPLDSLDVRSCISVCRNLFGAEITEYYSNEKLASFKVKGNNFLKKQTLIDVGNSGTALFFALAAAGLQSEPVEFTGDAQIQRRSAAPLLEALAGLGVRSQSNNGCVPITIKGKWAGGNVNLSCPTSQYLSALLIAAPAAPANTTAEIEVPFLNEKPYIDMTLSYLKEHGIPFEFSPDYSHFVVPGGSAWKAFSGFVSGDFSSAAFPAAAAAITGGEVTLLGLDPNDTQGDKFFFHILEEMGCNVNWNDNKSVTISRSGELHGGTFDLNDTPDLFPAAAAVAAYANGDTSLVNIGHARIKETDRIASMARELAKLGVLCTQLPDGLIVHGKRESEVLSLTSASALDGCGDHRIIMALAVAALGCNTPIEIINAENTEVSYPGFFSLVEIPFESIKRS